MNKLKTKEDFLSEYNRLLIWRDLWFRAINNKRGAIWQNTFDRMWRRRCIVEAKIARLMREFDNRRSELNRPDWI